MKLTHLVLLAMSLSAAGQALAEFRAVAVSAAVLYDGPSKQAKKLFVAPRGMPVEVLSILPAWVKIRDQSGDVLWMDRAELGPVKSVLTTSVVNIRQSAQETGLVLFQVEKGVLLEMTEAVGASGAGWVKVRHADGSYGFVKLTEVFGI